MRVKTVCVILLSAVFLLVACAGADRRDQTTSGTGNLQLRGQTQDVKNKIDALEVDLSSLNGQANMPEAKHVATAAITHSNRLAAEYRLMGSAVFHNVLVRLGLKDRGLCYHWTEDLIKHLRQLKLKNFQLHWGVAYLGSTLREHNSVVITARGQNFHEGIVLDPWRNSGNLFWTRVSEDSYPWQKRLPNEI